MNEPVLGSCGIVRAFRTTGQVVGPEANDRIGRRTSEINDWNGSQIFEMKHKIF
jgi:hypothetical protein